MGASSPTIAQPDRVRAQTSSSYVDCLLGSNGSGGPGPFALGCSLRAQTMGLTADRADVLPEVGRSSRAGPLAGDSAGRPSAAKKFAKRHGVECRIVEVIGFIRRRRPRAGSVSRASRALTGRCGHPASPPCHVPVRHRLGAARRPSAETLSFRRQHRPRRLGP